MTDTKDTETITQILAIIDRGLGDISERSLPTEPTAPGN
jgi:hypothetical protein